MLNLPRVFDSTFSGIFGFGRVQLSAGHDKAHLDKALAAFEEVGKKYDILGKSKEEIIANYGE